VSPFVGLNVSGTRTKSAGDSFPVLGINSKIHETLALLERDAAHVLINE